MGKHQLESGLEKEEPPAMFHRFTGHVVAALLVASSSNLAAAAPPLAAAKPQP